MHGIPSSKSNSNSNKPKKKQNFLEALRELGGGVDNSTAKDLTGGIAKTAFNQVSGRPSPTELKPNQAVDLHQTTQEPQPIYQEKKEQFQQFQQDYLDIRRQERLIFKQTEQDTKLQIAAVLEELKKLSLSTRKLAKEVKIASEQVPVEPGVYHMRFFERLRESILVFKKKVDESASWLEVFNKRSKKRNYYWNQVKKSGTKFMLSQERYMATQAG